MSRHCAVVRPRRDPSRTEPRGELRAARMAHAYSGTAVAQRPRLPIRRGATRRDPRPERRLRGIRARPRPRRRPAAAARRLPRATVHRRGRPVLRLFGRRPRRGDRPRRPADDPGRPEHDDDSGDPEAVCIPRHDRGSLLRGQGRAGVRVGGSVPTSSGSSPVEARHRYVVAQVRPDEKRPQRTGQAPVSVARGAYRISARVNWVSDVIFNNGPALVRAWSPPARGGRRDRPDRGPDRPARDIPWRSSVRDRAVVAPSAPSAPSGTEPRRRPVSPQFP